MPLRTRLHLIALACLASLGAPSTIAQVLPSGLQVARGQADVSVLNGAMTVRNSHQAILNWQDFSIGKGGSVYFAQPDSHSAVLNRVVSQNPSQLFGTLASNGQVWLLNPNGVLFGADARVDVAGLVTSTLRLNDNDWLAGRWRFAATPGESGDIVNQGQLRSSTGGRLILLGGTVRNEGSVEAPGGQVLLAGGQTMELLDSATPNLSLRLRSGPGEVLNLGSLHASGGSVEAQAAVVNQQGLVSASNLIAGPGGIVRLVASESLDLASASRTEADGARGGQVLLDGGSSGKLSLQGSVSAVGLAGAGGQVQALGKQVAVQGDARIDASGSHGGGLIQLGGGERGQDSSVRNSEALFFGSKAELRADATLSGDGGQVVLWSDKATRAYGSISARGAGAGAQGGFVETSGGWIDVRLRRLDLASPLGHAGRWLIDPFDVLITDAASDTNVTENAGTFTPTGPSSQISSLSLGSMMDNGVAVVVDTANGAGNQAGTITMSSANIFTEAPNPGSFTLRADANINITNSNILSSGGGPFDLNLQAGRSGNGQIIINNSSLHTGDGSLTLGGVSGALVSNGASQSAIVVSNSTLDSGAGSLSINATHTGPANTGVAAVLISSAVLNAGSINIAGSGSQAEGVWFGDSTLASSGSIGVVGTSTGTAGIAGGNGTRLQARSGALSLSGSGLIGVDLEVGNSASAPKLIAGNGSIIISGTGSGSTGVLLSGANQGELSATGGSVNISSSQGVQLSQFDLNGSGPNVVLSAGGALDVNSSQILGSGFTQIGGSSVQLRGTTTVQGNEVLVAGAGLGKAAGSINNSSSFGSSTLQASKRWIIWADNRSALTAGGLQNDFSRYSASAPAQWASDNGNGFAFASSAAATVTGSVQGKVYDGTTALQAGALSARDSVNGLTGSLLPNAVVSFADKNVGSNKPLSFNVAEPFGFVDGANRPVYGVTLLTAGLGASITPATLIVGGVTAADKVYDGSTATTAFNGKASVTPIAGDSVSLTGVASGNFASKNVGNALSVTWGGLSLAGTDSANYTLSYPNLSASITPRDATLTGLTVLDKVYDGSRNVTFNGSPAIVLLGGDSVSVVGTAAGSFADRNVGSAKAVLVSGLSLTGPDAGNYRLSAPQLNASITPLTLSVNGLTVQDRVYDGSLTVALSGTASVTPLVGDSVSLTGSVSASLADRNAGSGKTVNLAGLSLVGSDAGNYRLGNTLSTNIAPATLTYRADPVQLNSGQPIPLLSGSVSGLVGGDTLAGATTGTLSFSTPATTGSPPGLYAINGAGLSAVNYRFVQDPANATALQVAGVPPQLQSESGATQSQAALLSVSTPASTGSAGNPALGSSGSAGVVSTPIAGVVDTVAPPVSVVVSSATSTGTSSAASAFQPTALASMSDAAKLDMLAARQSFKDQLFARATQQLERNPSLADLPACARLADALAGNCLVTEPLRRQLDASGATATLPVTPAVAAAPAPKAAPTSTPTPAPASTAPAPVAKATAKPAPAPLRLNERRRVRTAALPQIERKLALVIGVDDYADSRMPALQNAVRDANAMAELFESTLGYETVVLRNPERAQVVGALNQLALTLRASDSVIVYYAGHGELVRTTQQGYWQLADADPERAETWLSNADISRLVAALPAAQVALVSDSCYSGSLVAEQRIRASQTPIDPIALLTRKTVVVMSSGGNEPVFDAGKDGHSPFAYNLLNQLRQVPDWRPGGQVFERVRFAVARELPQRPQYGASSSAGHQQGGDYLFEQRRLEK